MIRNFTLAALAVTLTGGIALAHSDGDEGHAMGGGMMGGGMMEGMMSQCKEMMGDDSARRGVLPELPAGNEALQFRMHAEMMQKIGEIAAGYADRIGNGNGNGK